MNTKQVIVIRKDLNMRKGKMSAQSAHASLGVFTRRMTEVSLHGIRGTLIKLFLRLLGVRDLKRLYNCNFTEEMLRWLDSSYTKIGVGCESEADLTTLQQMAMDSNVPHCLIKDNGQTEFKEECPDCKGTGLHKEGGMIHTTENCPVCNGSGKVNKPTYTCIAIGPDTCERIDQLTKRFPLL